MTEAFDPFSPLDTDRLEAVAASTLWAGLRLVVVDTETVTHDGQLHVVSLAVVTCRDGLVRGKWQTLIDPGVPVDAGSAAVHHLTDEHLAGEPDFASVAPQLLQALTAREGETVVLVAHKVAFDVTALRAGCTRAGLNLPDVPVLDTCVQLPHAVGVRPKNRSLAALAQALDIPQVRPHDALEDALVCAEATVALLEQAPQAGHHSIDSILAACGGHTTGTLTDIDIGELTRHDPPPSLPPEHVASHAHLLPANPDADSVTDWTEAAAECATLRCHHLDDRVAHAQADARIVHSALHDALVTVAGSGDIAGTATLLAAWLGVYDPPALSGAGGKRRAVLEWVRRWQDIFEQLGQCGDDDPCPRCRTGQACALDTWADTVALVAVGDLATFAKSFIKPTGADAGGGVHRTWRQKGHQTLADAGVWACIAHWRDAGQEDRAALVTQHALENGCEHPLVVEYHVGRIAARGTKTALTTARRTADRSLKRQAGSTHDGWGRLRARRNQIAGRLHRLQIRPSGQLDDNGNPIPGRRHHPDHPKRWARPRRFAL